MVLWIFQVRDKDVIDTLVPLGTELPSYEDFLTRCKFAEIELPEGFEQSYFRPCVTALLREITKNVIDDNTWYYCGFNCEGRMMAIHGLTESVYK